MRKRGLNIRTIAILCAALALTRPVSASAAESLFASFPHYASGQNECEKENPRWTDWRPLPAQGPSVYKADIRYIVGEFKHPNNTRQINWQFRNRYEYKIRLEVKLTFESDTPSGAEERQVKTLDEIGPGKCTGTRGAWSIAHRLKSAQVMKIIVLDGKPRSTVIEFPGPKRTSIPARKDRRH